MELTVKAKEQKEWFIYDASRDYLGKVLVVGYIFKFKPKKNRLFTEEEMYKIGDIMKNPN